MYNLVLLVAVYKTTPFYPTGSRGISCAKFIRFDILFLLNFESEIEVSTNFTLIRER